MTSPKQERRQTTKINPLLQGNLVRSITTVPCLCLGAISMGVIYFTSRLAREATRSDAELPSLVPLMYAVIAFVLLAAVFIVARAQRTAFHVAGPIYRFGETFKRIRTGDTNFRINLRKGDVLGGLKDEINLTLEWLEAHPPQGLDAVEDASPSEDVEADRPAAHATN